MIDRKLTIFVLDDEQILCTLYKLMLNGHRVETAQTPQAALELLAKEAPDLMLVDHDLHADVTGPEFCAQNFGKAVYLLSSSHYEAGNYTKIEADLQKSGALGTIGKPFTQETLLAAIENALNHPDYKTLFDSFIAPRRQAE